MSHYKILTFLKTNKLFKNLNLIVIKLVINLFMTNLSIDYINNMCLFININLTIFKNKDLKMIAIYEKIFLM